MGGAYLTVVTVGMGLLLLREKGKEEAIGEGHVVEVNRLTFEWQVLLLGLAVSDWEVISVSATCWKVCENGLQRPISTGESFSGLG